MDTHIVKERKLKADIVRKNKIGRELRGKLNDIDRWSRILLKSHRLQKRKKIEASIARYQISVNCLKKELLGMNEDLEKRIREEMTYSEEEIKAFQAELKRDTKELQKTQKQLEETDKNEKKPKPAISKTHFHRLLLAEMKKVERDEIELTSEDRDKQLFTHELKRITIERELYA